MRWADLKDAPLIAVRPGCGVCRTIDETAARAGVQLQISNEVGFVTSVSRSVCVVRKRGRQLSVACQAFVQTLADDLVQHRTA